MGDTVSVWEVVSKTWQALESIFLASEDIRSQLPDDTKRFEVRHTNCCYTLFKLNSISI